MHVVLIHFERVPVKLYGGTERVIESLAKGLLEYGHQVSLIALRGDYDIEGVNFLDLDRFGKQAKEVHNALTLIPKDADIAHFHLPVCEQECEKLGIPYICTLHGNKDSNPEQLPKHTVFLTDNHAKRHGRMHFVFNGLDASHAPLNITPIAKRSYFSFLGRASLKRKGLHLAKSLCRKLKTPLHVGGGRGLSWFNTTFLGHLNDEQKYELLGNSKALLFPILWEEPFGLVLIEAMFTGTPVFALKKGSVPEVLGQEGSEGLHIIAEDIKELEEKIKSYDFTHSPTKYRQYALKYFSYQKMSEEYLKKYQLVIDRNFC